MGRWFVTGDCHGRFERLWRFIKKFELGDDDFIIVCGDMGLYWNKDIRDAKYSMRQYEENCNGVRLYWIDGNHENFDIINKLKECDIISCSPHITYLGRGVSMDTPIGNMLFMGGADSVDKIFRTEHLSWWKDETITEDDIKGIEGHYDYVFSHACPRSIFDSNKAFLCTLNNINENNAIHKSEDMLEKLRGQITYDHWYFGHYHVNKKLDDKHMCLYEDFIEIGG